MTGDLDNVRLLLARGADPNLRSPISDAVTFGYPDVVAELVRGGASVGLRESTGINLLHWATITNRSTVIPELVKAGVPLNAEDDFLYTPLHYAGTIDFGETNSLRALLAAGANRNAKNEDGRTALEQARKLRHRAIAAELSR
jgi:ankyrin repeat protein